MESAVFGISSTTMMVVAVLTGVLLVFAALLIAKLIGPRSFTSMKSDPY